MLSFIHLKWFKHIFFCWRSYNETNYRLSVKFSCFWPHYMSTHLMYVHLMLLLCCLICSWSMFTKPLHDLQQMHHAFSLSAWFKCCLVCYTSLPSRHLHLCFLTPFLACRLWNYNYIFWLKWELDKYLFKSIHTYHVNLHLSCFRARE